MKFSIFTLFITILSLGETSFSMEKDIRDDMEDNYFQRLNEIQNSDDDDDDDDEEENTKKKENSNDKKQLQSLDLGITSGDFDIELLGEQNLAKIFKTLGNKDQENLKFISIIAKTGKVTNSNSVGNRLILKTFFEKKAYTVTNDKEKSNYNYSIYLIKNKEKNIIGIIGLNPNDPIELILIIDRSLDHKAWSSHIGIFGNHVCKQLLRPIEFLVQKNDSLLITMLEDADFKQSRAMWSKDNHKLWNLEFKEAVACFMLIQRRLKAERGIMIPKPICFMIFDMTININDFFIIKKID